MTERLTTIKSCTKCDHHLYTTVMHGDVEDLSPWIICAKEKRAFPLEGPAYSADPDKAEIPEWCPLEKVNEEDKSEEVTKEISNLVMKMNLDIGELRETFACMSKHISALVDELDEIDRCYDEEE
jgi:hypothetical protein